MANNIKYSEEGKKALKKLKKEYEAKSEDSKKRLDQRQKFKDILNVIAIYTNRINKGLKLSLDEITKKYNNNFENRSKGVIRSHYILIEARTGIRYIRNNNNRKLENNKRTNKSSSIEDSLNPSYTA